MFVASRLATSRTRAATLIATDCVRVNERQERASYQTVAGDTITVHVPEPEKREIAGEDIPLSIVYEDDALLVVDKPAGMVVHPAPGNWTGTMVNALLGRGHAFSGATPSDRPGIVHRLDKETSGLLIVAKTELAHRKLGMAIANRRVKRRYAVMIWGHLDQDDITIETPIARDPRDRKRMAVVATGKAARTDFRRLGRFGAGAGDLLRANLHTGRTHQIRVHLASIGHPVMGDDVYGGGGGRRLVALPPKRHFLHAAWLVFQHPVTGAVLDFRAPLPADLKHSLATIGGDPALEEADDPLVNFRFYEGFSHEQIADPHDTSHPGG